MTGTEPIQHTSAAVDAADWVRRWERQQGGYVPEREETFTLMLDVVHRLGAAPGRVLDLGCGPGSLAGRVLGRWPGAQVTGVDLDPVLLELGKRTLGDAVRWLEADLRRSSWTRTLDGPFDAVLSATALHWLDAGLVRRLATDVAKLLRPGGVFANYDTMLVDSSNPRLAALGDDLRDAIRESTIATRESETWGQWWHALRAEDSLTDQFYERARRFSTERGAPTATISQFVRSLKEGGFQEAAPLKQVANRHLLVAIR